MVPELPGDMATRAHHLPSSEKQVNDIEEADGNRYSGKILSVDEAIHQFPNQWILMRVTERDDYKNPCRGEIVRHSRGDPRIKNVLREIVSGVQETEHSYYFFYGSPRTDSGLEMRRMLARLSETGGTGTLREW